MCSFYIIVIYIFYIYEQQLYKYCWEPSLMLLWFYFSLYSFIELRYLIFLFAAFSILQSFLSFNSSEYGQINQAVWDSLSSPRAIPFPVFRSPLPIGTGCFWAYCTPSIWNFFSHFPGEFHSSLSCIGFLVSCA